MSADEKDREQLLAAHGRAANERMRQVLLDSVEATGGLPTMLTFEAAIHAMNQVANEAFSTGEEVGNLVGSDEQAAEITKLTAALADAEAKLDGIERVRLPNIYAENDELRKLLDTVKSENVDVEARGRDAIMHLRNVLRYQNAGWSETARQANDAARMFIDTLAQSPEDGKQP